MSDLEVEYNSHMQKAGFLMMRLILLYTQSDLGIHSLLFHFHQLLLSVTNWKHVSCIVNHLLFAYVNNKAI